MRKTKYIILTAIILILLSTNVMANNNLITVPTANVANRPYIYGEILSSRRQVEMAYGITPQIEVGAMLRSDRNKDPQLGLVAKTILVEETASTPSVGVGIRMNDLYFVTSKNLGLGIQGHLGIGNGELSGLFVGFNTILNPVSVSQSNRPALPPIQLMGEYANEKINLGVSMRLQDNMNFDLGLLDMRTLKLGLGYRF
ncbi:hypothetical protein [Natronospora cellulosivora (SeqCode)]